MKTARVKNNKFCAFGIGYLDRKGEIIEESKNYFVVHSKGAGIYKLALSKHHKLTKVFNTEKECDDWINEQDYQYDER